MKEEYFTEKNIDFKARRMLKMVERFRHDHDLTFAPDRSALMIIDMQRYFVDPGSHAFLPSVTAVIPRINRLLAAYRRHGLPVLFTKHQNTKRDARMLDRWWHEFVDVKSKLCAISENFRIGRSPVIEKTQYDAFYKTPLERLLKRWSVTQIVITGVMTHLCCETTARAAFVRGFETFFTIDGTATQNQDFHVATLKNLSHGFAVPVLTREILASLDHAR